MKSGRILEALGRYIVFFIMVAFVITCSMMLFLSIMSWSLDLTLTGEILSDAAKLTFLNVLLLSFLYTTFDAFRRKLTVDRPAEEILRVLRELKAGDFQARISVPFIINKENRFRDIAENINCLAEELSSVETLRTDFMANVSHEMKTPLAVMQNYSQLLQSPDLAEEKRMEYARAITDTSRRLADLMTNILKLNRLENQQIYPKAQEFDLGEQLCQCLLQYESVWERAEIDLDTDIADGVIIRADAELLALVWNNLFSNAFKFTPPGGKVTVSLTGGDYYAVVKVTDTGCGMSAEVGAHIFEKFYQGDTSRATAGNGLGLALVKRIMDITGGEISVTSALGAGSTFTVQLRKQT